MSTATRKVTARDARLTTEELTGALLRGIGPKHSNCGLLARQSIDGVLHCARCDEPVQAGQQCGACRERTRSHRRQPS